MNKIKISEKNKRLFLKNNIENVKEFIKLIETYDNISYEQLRREWYMSNCYKINSALTRITGWGNYEECTLCVKTRRDCFKCVWSVLNPYTYPFFCTDQSFKNISCSKDFKELWVAIKRRKNKMIKLLEKE